MKIETFEVPPVGHSLGWFNWKVSPNLRDMTSLIRSAGLDACELTCGIPERDAALEHGELGANLSLRKISMHLGDFRSFETLLSDEREVTSQFVARLSNRHSVSSTALHPDLAPDVAIRELKAAGVPVAIENMDRLKGTSRTVAEVMVVIDRNTVPLVLDLQHAFENAVDAGIAPHELVRDFATEATQHNRIGIAHLHVSGEVSETGTQRSNHASLGVSTNRDEIFRSLKIVRDVYDGRLPAIILEGDYSVGLPARAEPLRQEQIDEATSTIAERMRRERELVLNELGY